MTIHLVNEEHNIKASVREVKEGIKLVQKFPRKKRITSMFEGFHIDDVIYTFQESGFKKVGESA